MFTVKDLVRLLREAAGEDEPGLLDGDIVDAEFADLGYDSVAVLQVVSLIEREYGVTLADETVVEARTPHMLVGTVNAAMADATV